MAEVERAIGRLVDAVDCGDYSQSLAEREGEGSALLLQVPEVQHRLVQRAERYGKVTCLSRESALQQRSVFQLLRWLPRQWIGATRSG